MTDRKLSTGEDSTLGNYRKLCVAVWGERSAPVKFIDHKISESPRGADEPVIQSEKEMLELFCNLRG